MTNVKPWLRKADEGKVEVMGAKIEIIKKISHGQSKMATKAAMKINSKTGEIDIDSGLMSDLRVLAHIKDWELTDENDNKLPISLETLELLDEKFVAELTKVVNEEADDETTEDEKKA